MAGFIVVGVVIGVFVLLYACVRVGTKTDVQMRDFWK